MGAFFKKLLTIAIICAIVYALMGYHYIIVDKSLKMLKKIGAYPQIYTL